MMSECTQCEKRCIGMKHEFDVIIVGGRVAGAHLAARLGKYGFDVLLLERAEHPSLPAVSSPIIYASTMRMLDEIAADETAYAHNTPKLYHMMSVTSAGKAKLTIPEYKGRDYAYAIDRARFDAALWDTAMSYERVTGYQNFSVTDLLWENERVVGVIGKRKGGEETQFRANVIVGADGRFGLVSRKVDAQETDQHDRFPTSIYYAYWRNVDFLDGEPSAAAYEGANAYGYLVMDSADGETVIAIEGRADVVEPDKGNAERFYLELLQANPAILERMQEAEMITSVRGMRNIGNSYRQAGGAGWALVGDAYHQKDPLDGQGIYNAVVTGKALARELLKWKKGEQSWDATLANYDETARIKTYPMYKSLQTRVRTSFYANSNITIPEWAQENLAKWLLDDPSFNDLMGKMLTRELPPDMITLLAPPTIVGALARGVHQEMVAEFKKRIPFFAGDR